MKVCIPKHQCACPITSKGMKDTLPTSVRNHMLNSEQTVVREDFFIFGRELNHYLLEKIESFLIKRDKPFLNRKKYSIHLNRIIFVLIVGL